MDVIERARRYLSRMDGSISGAGGHNAAFAAACAMVKGFDLPEAVAMGLLREEFNPKCSPPWSDRELLHKVRQAANSTSAAGYLIGQEARRASAEEWKAKQGAKPAEKLKKEQEVDHEALRRMMVREAVDEHFLLDRSPVDVRGMTRPEEFLGALYQAGEKVLIFTSEKSQGDFGFEVGADGGGTAWRLGARPGVAAERAEMPGSGRLGVWFLSNPVDGKWKPNGGTDRNGRPMLSRRSAPNVTEWRFLLLESDELSTEVWLNVLVQLPLPIAAVYTSGGRSVHALVRLDARTQDELRRAGDMIGPLLAKLGGDWKALSSVRLTRLPLCFREGKMVDAGDGKPKRYQKYPEPLMQRLLWLDPEPEPVAILTRAKARDTRRDTL
jgi:hypothetical protein